ncbi:MAG: energy transducer TonB [Sphingomicrobium sp.]
MSSNRTVSIIVVALLHVVLGYALVTGLAYNVLKKATTDLKTFDVTEPPPPPEEKPPPPEKQPDTPPPPQVAAPPPLVRMPSPPVQIQTTPNPPPFVPTPTARPAPPAPPAPPPPPVKQQAAKAKGSLVGLFSNDDYPASALQSEQQGTTAVTLTIGTNGRVSGCDVTSSSGSSALDGATCSILRSRARFTPAIDSNGSPTTDTYSQRITWRIPAE